MEWQDLILPLASIGSSLVVAVIAYKTAQDSARREQLADRAAAFRDNQVDAVDRILAEATELLQLLGIMDSTWQTGRPQKRYGLEQGAGPGIEDSEKDGRDTHEYHGIRMDYFHQQCRSIERMSHRVHDDELRRAFVEFARRAERFRWLTSLEEMSDYRTAIRSAHDDLVDRGGAYIRELISVDGNWYRSIVARNRWSEPDRRT